MKAYPQEQIEIKLPEGFTERGATLNDLNEAIKLMNVWSQNVLDEDEILDKDELLNEMKIPGFEPEDDLRVVFAPNGEMVGYIEVWTTSKPPVHPWIWGRVHPDYEGLGIGTWLMHWAEKRALRVLDNIPEDLRLAPRTGIQSVATGSMELFEDMGYKQIRSSYRMKIEMDAPVPEPEWPEGITLKPYNPETDAEAVYRADTEAFRDHFGFIEQPFEEGFKNFMHNMTQFEGFDPTLWFIAMDGNEIAGVCLCRPRAYDDLELGFVATLAVRRPWRKRGLGLALLRHSFNEFYQRGNRKVGLGVDAENLTGALRLYEKAGMHIYRQYNSYEKELRAGKEISVQSLSE
ncbi:MAG TPA: GNAT family N-acetyltransferase [Anaerolineales bacterium]|nr:GNAT family N-acetyltransferase [Anaerolineales bacterium]